MSSDDDTEDTSAASDSDTTTSPNDQALQDYLQRQGQYHFFSVSGP